MMGGGCQGISACESAGCGRCGASVDAPCKYASTAAGVPVWWSPEPVVASARTRVELTDRVDHLARSGVECGMNHGNRCMVTMFSDQLASW